MAAALRRRLHAAINVAILRYVHLAIKPWPEFFQAPAAPHQVAFKIFEKS
jgi:hypothetical protein